MDRNKFVLIKAFKELMRSTEIDIPSYSIIIGFFK